MTCKLLHHYVRKSGGYTDDVDFAELVKMYNLDLIVLDFCALFFFLLRSEQFASRLLLYKLCERGMWFYLAFCFCSQQCHYSPSQLLDPGRAAALNLPLSYDSTDAIITEIVDKVISSVHSLLNGTEENPPRVCFVIDGEPLPAKRETHKTRAQRSRQHLRLARKLVRNYLGLPPAARTADKQRQFLARVSKYASGWVRWWSHLKVGLADRLVKRGCAAGFPAGDSQFSVVMAPFEADPKVIEIASLSRNSAVVSTDGDLHVYPFADDALVSKALTYKLFRDF